MARRSSVERLPLQVQAEIGRLRQTYTLDQIMAHLQTMGGPAASVSRSSLHRYVRKVDQDLAEDLRQARGVSAYLGQALDEAPGSSAARLNVELLHNEVFALLRKAAAARKALESGNLDDAATLEAKGIMHLARTVVDLTRAARQDLEFMQDLEKRASERTKTEAAQSVERVAKEKGISAETIAALKASFLGVSGAKPA